MPHLTINFDMNVDPLFEELTLLCEKSDQFAAQVQRLIDDDNLIHVFVGGLSPEAHGERCASVIHLTDAALELVYREKARI